MKKIFLFCFMLFCFVGIANAQWREPFYSEGDELTRSSDVWMYTYADYDGIVTFVDYLNNDKNSDWINFKASGSFFNFDIIDPSAKCIIGFYSDNELIEIITTEVSLGRNMSNSVVISTSNDSDVSIVEKIIKHLTTVGDVRFVIPTYNTDNFDITVTKNSELFKNTTK